MGSKSVIVRQLHLFNEVFADELASLDLSKIIEILMFFAN
jgi:hypothetical protein